jgi:hypothetical protein
MTAILFHTAEQAETALAAGAPNLVTTPGASAFAGPAYLAEAVAHARALHPKSRAEAWIDCGEDAGMVLRAIKAGWRHVVFAGRGPAMGRITDICAQAKVDVRSGLPRNSTTKKARLRS